MRGSWHLGFPLLAALSGCAGTVVGDAADAETSSSTAAVVVVERTTAAGEAPRGEAVARFMRVRGVPWDDALRVVGARVDFPLIGSCVSVSTLGTPRPSPSSAVQLLDVGAVAMEANGTQTQLYTRRVPDVVDLVSGVVYARAADADGLPAGARYDVRVSGGLDPELLAFQFSASAPEDLQGVRIGGQDLTEAVLSLGTGSVELNWDPGAEDDVIYVDLRAQAATIRCAFADDGQATIPAEAFAASDEGTLGIHRLHREQFHAAGIDSGELRFDFARVVAYARR